MSFREEYNQQAVGSHVFQVPIALYKYVYYLGSFTFFDCVTKQLLCIIFKQILLPLPSVFKQMK